MYYHTRRLTYILFNENENEINSIQNKNLFNTFSIGFLLLSEN